MGTAYFLILVPAQARLWLILFLFWINYLRELNKISKIKAKIRIGKEIRYMEL